MKQWSHKQGEVIIILVTILTLQKTQEMPDVYIHGLITGAEKAT
jgi:hypothetical protein